MKFSENPNFDDYVDHFAYGRYELARHAIFRCIDDKNDLPDPIQMSYLLKITGDLFFLEGNIQDALCQYQLSEQADSDSLLAKYFFAKFLGENLKDYIWATQKCDEIIDFATHFPFPNTEDDYGSDDYINMANELKNAVKKTRNPE